MKETKSNAMPSENGAERLSNSERDFLCLITTVLKDEIIGDFDLNKEGLTISLLNKEKYLITVKRI